MSPGRPIPAVLALTAGVSALALAGCERHRHELGFPAADAGDAPAFQLAELDLASRKTARWWTLPDGGPAPESEYYPCSDCHDDEMARNPEVRALKEDHDEMVFDHGGGRIWCLSCHHLQDRAKLTDAAGRALGWERPDRACASCHAEQQRDFEHGVHGKRMDGYTGARKLASCVACHDPHAPAIRPRKPKPPPLRSRLELGRRR